MKRKISEIINNSSRICVPCGLCCDGTLIGFVELDPVEMPAIKQLMELENEDGNGFFLQPCKKLCDGCTIYEERPKNCAKFKCELLHSVEQKELTVESAIETTQVVKEKRASIQRLLPKLQLELKSPSFYFQMVELKNVIKRFQSESSLTQEHLDLMSELDELDMLLAEKFGVTMN